jgi:hypothetical protein
MPESLERLIQKLLDAVAGITTRLERGEMTVKAWQREMERLLTRYHEAAFMIGQESPELDEEALAIIVEDVAFQLGFLDEFAQAIASGIASGAGWSAAWNARAAMYAQAVKKPYWQGEASRINVTLPGMPCESECLSNCGCYWDIQQVSGGFDAYWRRGKNDSCNGCRQREREWNPFKIRKGKAQ